MNIINALAFTRRNIKAKASCCWNDKYYPTKYEKQNMNSDFLVARGWFGEDGIIVAAEGRTPDNGPGNSGVQLNSWVDLIRESGTVLHIFQIRLETKLLSLCSHLNSQGALCKIMCW